MTNIYDRLDLDALGIDKTKFRDKGKKSISLGIDLEEKACGFLQEKFIEEGNRPYFAKQFAQAISGDGNELMKMDAAKSSSLCSLLFFYNLADEDGRRLTIEGITYTRSFFEYKNKVYRNPSNMDVVLTNAEGDILFVECKFSEYFERDDSPTISATYFTDERSAGLMGYLVEQGILRKGKKDAYTAYYGGERIHATGLKQIVAHYVGIGHFLAGDYPKEQYGDDRDLIKDIPNKKVRFIEVLFDLGEELKNYKDASDALIAHISKPDQFLQSTTYQAILSENPQYKLDEMVKKYYRY